MEEVYQGLLLVSRERKGHEQSRVGHKEKLDGDTGSVEASANPAGIFDTGVTLLNSVELVEQSMWGKWLSSAKASLAGG